MENNLHKVLEMFNLTYKEEFYLDGRSELKYRFDLDGLKFYAKNNGWTVVYDNILEKLLLGEFEITTNWKPKQDDAYYFPDIKKGEPCSGVATWRNSILDNSRYEAKMIFRTKDEALTCAKEILNFLAEK